MGLHQQLRRLPDLPHLQPGPGRPLRLRHLLDRLDAGLPHLLRRRLHRPSHRRGLLPAHFRLGHCLANPRHLRHLLRRRFVLAALPRAGRVHGPGQRVPVLPVHEHPVDLLQQEEEPGDRDRGERVGYGGLGFPDHGEAVAAQGRVCVDGEGDGVYCCREFGGKFVFHQAAGEAETERADGGVGGAEGAGVFVLYDGEFLREYPPPFCWLLGEGWEGG